MTANQVILLISLAGALAAYGLAQILLGIIDGDRQKLQQRLASEWRNDVDALLNRSLMMRPELKGLPPVLARHSFLVNLNRKLVYAYPEAKLTRFLAITWCLACGLFCIATLFFDSLVFGLIGAAIGLYLPFLLIRSKRSRRQRALGEQLPDALDFLTRILRAGHSLSTGMQMMGDELPQPIAGEFRRCYDQHALGQSIEDALREMAGRVDSSDFAFFVTAVLIQRQTGGNLAEVLGNIARMVRNRIHLKDHVKAITAEGRLTGYILFCLPIVLFVVSYVLNPAYAGVLVRTDMGRLMLLGAGSMQLIGLFFIHRIVAVKV